MPKAELHAQDVADRALQTVQAGGRVHVVAPDPDVVGRWYTLRTFTNMAHAQAFIEVRRSPQVGA